ncbi:hypothetical protein EV715DRAFT_202163 [Schizophyllum commune]
MTRRPRSKRPRHTFVAGPDKAPTSYRDILSVELWHEVFSYCLPRSLFAVRDTCRLFRDIVDRNDGALLARAPLLLPRPPPDPRRFMRFTRHPEKLRAMGELFGISDPWRRGSFGSATYTKLLFLPGRCYICKGRAEGPPTWITHMIYLCSRPCRLAMFRTKVVYLLPEKGYLPHPTSVMDRHIVPWLPSLSMTKTHNKPAVLRSELKKARREYQHRVFAASTPEQRRHGQAVLFEVSPLNISQIDDHLHVWREQMDRMYKEILKKNRKLYVYWSSRAPALKLMGTRLRRFVSKQKIPMSEALDNSNVRRTLLACSRDFCRITPSILSDAGLSGARPTNENPKREKCAHCGEWVSRLGLDYHIVHRHPSEVSQSRLNPTTGLAEYQCELCAGLSLRWFSAQSLLGHQYDIHNVREAEEEWRPSEAKL